MQTKSMTMTTSYPTMKEALAEIAKAPLNIDDMDLNNVSTYSYPYFKQGEKVATDIKVSLSYSNKYAADEDVLLDSPVSETDASFSA